MTIRLRETPMQSDAGTTLDPRDWDEIRALGHRMLDDMIDHIATIRAGPVWQPIPDAVRAQFGEALPRRAVRARRGLSRVQRLHRAIRDRKCASRLHGLGPWRRLRGRHARGNAGGRAQRQSRRPRSYADRGRAADRCVDGGDVRLSRRRQRNFRHRHLDGQSDGGRGGAEIGAGAGRPAAWPRRGRRAADRLYVEGCAWLHQQGDGHRGPRQRCAAMHRDRSGASHRCGRAARADRARSRERAEAVPGGRHRPGPWMSVRSTISQHLPRCAGTSSSGFTSTAPSARSQFSRMCWRRGLPASSRRTRLRWISTNGVRCPTTPASCWCATANGTATPLLRPRPIFGGRPVDLRRARSGRAISAPICRADSARSRPGSRSRPSAPRSSARSSRAAARWRAISRQRVLAEPRLELLAPVNLNIVCFRYRADDANTVNGEIVIDIQESGIAAPSTTVLDGRLAIRAAIVNHRTDVCDIDALVDAVLEFGARKVADVVEIESPPLAT